MEQFGNLLLSGLLPTLFLCLALLLRPLRGAFLQLLRCATQFLRGAGELLLRVFRGAGRLHIEVVRAHANFAGRGLGIAREEKLAGAEEVVLRLIGRQDEWWNLWFRAAGVSPRSMVRYSVMEAI